MIVSKSTDVCTKHYVRMSVTLSFVASNAEMQIFTENIRKSKIFESIMKIYLTCSLFLCCLCFLSLSDWFYLCLSAHLHFCQFVLVLLRLYIPNLVYFAICTLDCQLQSCKVYTLNIGIYRWTTDFDCKGV